MARPAVRKFGFELEVASGADAMVRTLYADGVMRTDHLHDYHCRCVHCLFQPAEDFEHLDARGRPLRTTVADLRAQRDSTANGEFISRPIDDWDDFDSIVGALTQAASAAGAETNTRCGLHVHVDTFSDLQEGMVDRNGFPTDNGRAMRRRIVPAPYLAFERYFSEIVAPGASVRKREMNQTLMQAARMYVSNQWGARNSENWMDMGRGAVDDLLLQVIGADRHVDLNWSRNHSTWEFRCFNATNAPWRIELACRIATAFVEAAPQLRDQVESVVRGSKSWPVGCDSPWGEIIRPAYSELPAPHPTKRPIVPMDEFIETLCGVDPDLRPLIERQANYMLTRYATQIEVAV